LFEVHGMYIHKVKNTIELCKCGVQSTKTTFEHELKRCTSTVKLLEFSTRYPAIYLDSANSFLITPSNPRMIYYEIFVHFRNDRGQYPANYEFPLNFTIVIIIEQFCCVAQWKTKRFISTRRRISHTNHLLLYLYLYTYICVFTLANTSVFIVVILH